MSVCERVRVCECVSVKLKKDMSDAKAAAQVPLPLQGYLAHNEQRPPRTLQQDFAQRPMVASRGGGCMSEAPL